MVDTESSPFTTAADMSLLSSGDAFLRKVMKCKEQRDSYVPLSSYSNLKVLSLWMLQLMPPYS